MTDVRVVMAPVYGQLYSSSRSSLFVAHGFTEFSRGGSKLRGMLYGGDSDWQQEMKLDYVELGTFRKQKLIEMAASCRTAIQ